MLYRRKFIIAFPILICVAVGWMIAAGQTATYQASAVMVLDTRKIQVINFDSVISRLPQDNAVLRSELDLISSRMLAERVVDKLHLEEDSYLRTPQARLPPWAGPLRSLQTSLKGWFPARAELVDDVFPKLPASPNPPTRKEAVDHVISGLRVANDGRSYTIVVSFTSFDPAHSARVANTVAEQYLYFQTEMKTEATRQANVWLSRRLSELRQALETSERTIEDYRQSEGLFEADGELLDVNRLSQLNARLDEVRVKRMESEARLTAVRNLIRNGAVAGGVNETANSEVLRALRQQEIELRRRIADLSSRVYDQHPQLIALKNDLAVIQRRAEEEGARIVNMLTNEVNIARSQEASMGETLTILKQEHGRANAGAVTLRQLIREADANRSMYEVVLNRYKETADQVDLQRPDGSIISPASAQIEPDQSRKNPIIVLSALGGALLGLLLGLLRERLDQAVRSVSVLERATGLPVLGLVPEMRCGWFTKPQDRIIKSSGPALRDALRITHIAIRPRSIINARPAPLPSHVVMVTSSLPGEGKTTFCISMARMLAADGKRVMLIDADLLRPHVGSELKAKDGPDLVDLLEGVSPIEDVVRVDTKSGLHFVTGRAGSDNPQSLLSGAAFQHFIQVCSNRYDMVIIDTPPVLTAIDCAVVAPLTDACVVLARWGHTRLDTLLAGLRLLHLCNVKVSGVVLNRVRVTRHRGYQTYAEASRHDIYPPVYPPASLMKR